MKSTRLITKMAVFVAIGTISSHLLSIPTGIAKAFPIQHAINVVAAVMLGPVPAVMVSFTIALLRNLLGVGTLLAFPGSMIGALLAGLLYKRFNRIGAAALGETVGTGLIASIVSVPYATLLMGKAAGAFAFLPSFLISSFIGAAIGWAILGMVRKAPLEVLSKKEERLYGDS